MTTATNRTNVSGNLVNKPLERFASTALLRPKYPLTRPTAVPLDKGGKTFTVALTAVAI